VRCSNASVDEHHHADKLGDEGLGVFLGEGHLTVLVCAFEGVEKSVRVYAGTLKRTRTKARKFELNGREIGLRVFNLSEYEYTPITEYSIE
jgi:hypothetical protein